MGYNISRRYEALVQEYLDDAGVRVLKRHYARLPVLADDGCIAAVIVEDLASFQTVRIEVEGVVIESSGGALSPLFLDAVSRLMQVGEVASLPRDQKRTHGTAPGYWRWPSPVAQDENRSRDSHKG